MIRKHAIAETVATDFVLMPEKEGFKFSADFPDTRFEQLLHTGAMKGRAALPERWGYVPQPGFIYTTNRAISSRVNANYDGWTPQGLEQDHLSFVGRPCYVEHQNWDHRRTRGVILGAKLHKDVLASGDPDYWVELLKEIDAQSYPRLAAGLISGDLHTTSMGCDIDSSTCSVCGNNADTPLTFCAHIPGGKGRMIGGRLCYEICQPHYAFFEDSFVFDPADESAFVSDVYIPERTASVRVASRLRRDGESVQQYHNRIRRQAATREMLREKIIVGKTAGAPSALLSVPSDLNTLSEDKKCPRCGNQFNGEYCDECGYEETPESLSDPDTDPRGPAKQRFDQALQEHGELPDHQMSVDEYQQFQAQPDQAEVGALDEAPDESQLDPNDPLAAAPDPAAAASGLDSAAAPTPQVGPAVSEALNALVDALGAEMPEALAPPTIQVGDHVYTLQSPGGAPSTDAEGSGFPPGDKDSDADEGDKDGDDAGLDAFEEGADTAADTEAPAEGDEGGDKDSDEDEGAEDSKKPEKGDEDPFGGKSKSKSDGKDDSDPKDDSDDSDDDKDKPKKKQDGPPWSTKVTRRSMASIVLAERVNIGDLRHSEAVIQGNRTRYRHDQHVAACDLCGMPQTPGTLREGWWIEPDADGFLIQAGRFSANSQGTRLVGPECAKRVPDEYLQRFVAKRRRGRKTLADTRSGPWQTYIEGPDGTPAATQEEAQAVLHRLSNDDRWQVYDEGYMSEPGDGMWQVTFTPDVVDQIENNGFWSLDQPGVGYVEVDTP